MSETRYTPEQMRARAVVVVDDPCTCSGDFMGVCSHCAETAAMLRQAATDAEALEALRARYSNLAEEQVDAEAAIERTEKAEAALTAQRQKVRELREKLVKRQDAHTRDINEGDEELEEMRRSCILSIQATLDDMDTLGLDGSHGG